MIIIEHFGKVNNFFSSYCRGNSFRINFLDFNLELSILPPCFQELNHFILSREFLISNRSDEGLTPETSAFKLFTLANLRFHLSCLFLISVMQQEAVNLCLPAITLRSRRNSQTKIAYI